MTLEGYAAKFPNDCLQSITELKSSQFGQLFLTSFEEERDNLMATVLNMKLSDPGSLAIQQQLIGQAKTAGDVSGVLDLLKDIANNNIDK